MSSFNFILDGLRFSYSSVSSYQTCPYSFKLAYIEIMPRIGNFYSDFGLLIHDCLEKYFKGELESFELSQYYADQYDSFVTSFPPPYPVGIADKYKEQGQAFFDFFYFDRSDFDALLIEAKIDFELDGILVVAKPDLILREKKTNKLILYDYKTATPFWRNKNTDVEMFDKVKIQSYYNQMYIYTYALRHVASLPIDEIAIWYVRADKIVKTQCDIQEENEKIKTFSANIKRIKQDENFLFNNSNQYFCDNLCGVRNSCEYG